MKQYFVEELLQLVKEFREVDRETPISIALTPISIKNLIEFKRYNVDFLGVGLDGATPWIFRRIRKPFTWNTYLNFIRKAIDVFGKDKVCIHVIVGLGENLKELINTMKIIYSLGARIALFNYTYIKGINIYRTVDLSIYRIAQLARGLLEEGYDPETYIDFENMKFKRDLPINPLMYLLTSGCPGCNRPFYNETPGKVIYNYPNVEYLLKRKNTIVKELEYIGVHIE